MSTRFDYYQSNNLAFLLMKLGKDFELLLHVGEGVMKFVLVYIIIDIVNGYTYF